jgi:Ca2+-dependent lipid-binding protein
LPDPFAVATVNGDQTQTTQAAKRSLNPYWNEQFDFRVNEDSIVAVQVFDQKKFKKKDQGFLGVINVRVGDVIPNLEIAFEGNATAAGHSLLGVYMLTNWCAPLTLQILC